MSRQNSKKVRKFKRPLRLNLGVIAFLVIAIYIVITFIIYCRKPRISIYEVVEKQLSNGYDCTGLILRDETIVNTSQSGYLNYYYSDGTKVGKNAVVYTVDETGEIYELLSSSSAEDSLSKSDRKLLWDDISEFRKTYKSDEYSSVSDFVYNVENTVLELSTSSMAENVKKILKENHITDNYTTVSTEQSGIISYSMDGYENKNVDAIGPKDFVMADYEKRQLRTSEKLESGDPAYKLITGEDWTIVLSVPEDLYQQLNKRQSTDKKNGEEVSYVDITLSRENIDAKVPYELYKKEDGYFAKLTMDRYVVHYIDDRYIDVEISLDQAEGLKIPTSSILKKEFYVVPADYFTEAGDNGATGLIKEVYDKSGDVTYSFIEVSNYYETDEGVTYVDKDMFSAGEWIRNEATQERYQIGETKKIKGVYNVNYGYCLFRQVEILYKNEEYCIVKAGCENGVAAYDHIVVDANTVSEDDLINNYKGD